VESSTTHPAAKPTLEEFTYDDAIVRKFVWATVIWAIVGMAVGLFIALELAFPKLNLLPQLNFGRLRPLHTNAVIFAFAGNAIFAAIYYSTQRLLKCRMWSDKLSNIHFWGWQAIIVSAALTLPFGITQSKEYAELEWPIDIAIAVIWLGVFGGNMLMTLIHRRERHIYVAIWFYIATIVTVALLHVFNNLWVPVGAYEFLTTGKVTSYDNLMKSYPVYAGVQDAFMQWWYGHNAVAFFLTTPFLGLMYYFLPKAANRPVFSYRLSIVHFWSLIFIYIWAGPHHLHYTALPQWASTLGMVFSVMLWMPSWGGMINGLLTLRGAFDRFWKEPILRFFFVGITFYGMSTFEGPLLSIKAVNSLSHYTDWTIGHVHSGALGWNGFMTFGMIYWLAPRLFQTKGVHSVKLMNLHFWLGLLGLVIYYVSMVSAGIVQGLDWRAFDEAGALKYGDFLETVIKLQPFYWLRALGGAMYLVGVLFGLYNLVRTWMARPATYEEPVHRAPALRPEHYDDAPRPASRLTANIDLGHKGDVWLQGKWHRTLEGRPVRFTIWVTIAVVAASLFEIIPSIIVPAFSKAWSEANVPRIASVQPYSPLELIGRDIYVAEGCYNCHSQMIRPIFAETERYGEYSKPGEFIYDRPFQWGSRRIGPDLAREGGRQSSFWHITHFDNAQLYNAGSIMPSYRHLVNARLNFDEIEPRVGVMRDAFAVPYLEGRAEEDARAQALVIAEEIATQAGGIESVLVNPDESSRFDSLEDLSERRVVALIAYIQRLGIDLYAPPPGETTTAGASPLPTKSGELE